MPCPPDQPVKRPIVAACPRRITLDFCQKRRFAAHKGRRMLRMRRALGKAVGNPTWSLHGSNANLAHSPPESCTPAARTLHVSNTDLARKNSRFNWGFSMLDCRHENRPHTSLRAGVLALAAKRCGAGAPCLPRAQPSPKRAVLGGHRRAAARRPCAAVLARPCALARWPTQEHTQPDRPPGRRLARRLASLPLTARRRGYAPRDEPGTHFRASGLPSKLSPHGSSGVRAVRHVRARRKPALWREGAPSPHDACQARRLPG